MSRRGLQLHVTSRPLLSPQRAPLRSVPSTGRFECMEGSRRLIITRASDGSNVEFGATVRAVYAGRLHPDDFSVLLADHTETATTSATEDDPGPSSA